MVRSVTGQAIGLGPARMRRLASRALAAIALIVGAAAIGFLVWALTPLGPSADALAALESGDGVTVTHAEGAWLFLPETASDAPETGLVFYPGGRVDARSYAPFARALAAEGHAVAIVKMPLSLAVLKPGAASGILAMPQLAGVSRWAAGGHSLGGAMAAQFVADGAPECVRGLLLLAAYAPEGADLSDSGLYVVDVTASLDTVLDADAWASGKALLPGDTLRVTVPGGNHAGFGSYGAQSGDAEATITPDEQLAITVRAADELLDSL